MSERLKKHEQEEEFELLRLDGKPAVIEFIDADYQKLFKDMAAEIKKKILAVLKIFKTSRRSIEKTS